MATANVVSSEEQINFDFTKDELIQERYELLQKIKKLTCYQDFLTAHHIDGEEAELINNQIKAMNDYADCLIFRVALYDCDL